MYLYLLPTALQLILWLEIFETPSLPSLIYFTAATHNSMPDSSHNPPDNPKPHPDALTKFHSGWEMEDAGPCCCGLQIAKLSRPGDCSWLQMQLQKWEPLDGWLVGGSSSSSSAPCHMPHSGNSFWYRVCNSAGKYKDFSEKFVNLPLC